MGWCPYLPPYIYIYGCITVCMATSFFRGPESATVFIPQCHSCSTALFLSLDKWKSNENHQKTKEISMKSQIEVSSIWDFIQVPMDFHWFSLEINRNLMKIIRKPRKSSWNFKLKFLQFEILLRFLWISIDFRWKSIEI